MARPCECRFCCFVDPSWGRGGGRRGWHLFPEEAGPLLIQRGWGQRARGQCLRGCRRSQSFQGLCLPQRRLHPALLVFPHTSGEDVRRGDKDVRWLLRMLGPLCLHHPPHSHHPPRRGGGVGENRKCNQAEVLAGRTDSSMSQWNFHLALNGVRDPWGLGRKSKDGVSDRTRLSAGFQRSGKLWFGI